MSGWDDPALSRATAPTSRPNAADHALLGAGGEAIVVSGPDRSLPRAVAWKVIAAADARGAERLTNEASILAELEHPAIVPVYGLFSEPDGGLRLALRQIRGQNLAEMCARRADLSSRLRLVRHVLAVAQALAFSHHRGILHRDVTSRNVMVGEFGETQLIDWGLARRVDASDPPGTIVGTPQAMSPEQARGESVGVGTDVWGLGVILVEICAGRGLFVDETAEAIIDSLATGRIPDVEALCVGAPPDLVAVTARALGAHPSERYADMRAFADDLAAFLDGRSVSARQYSTMELVRRFARVFRWPLLLGLGMVATVAISATVAHLRISAERDDAIEARDTARVALVRAGTVAAQRELDDGFQSEAELAAAGVLEIEESPEARGVIAAFARSPRPSRRLVLPVVSQTGIALACPTPAVSPDGGRLVCASSKSVEIFDVNGFGRVGFLGEAAFSVSVSEEALAFSLPHRGVSRLGFHGDLASFDGCGGDIASFGGAFTATGSGCVAYLDRVGAQIFRPCASGTAQSSTPIKGGFASLCEDGRLVIVKDGATRAVPTPLRSTVGLYRVLTPTSRGQLAVGTAQGQVLVIDSTSGAVVASREARPGRLIRQLQYDAESDRVIATVDGGGVLLLRARTLALSGRLPRTERGAWFTAKGLVSISTAGPPYQLTYWEVPDGSIHVLEGRDGVTSVRIAGGRIATTYTETAELLDSNTGRTVASFRWVGLPGNVTKAMVPAGDGAFVAITARPDAIQAVPGEPFVAFGGARRLVRVADGPDGGLRMARTGGSAGFHLLAGGAEHVITEARQLDVEAHGRWLVALQDSPRLVRLFEMGDAPLEVASCPLADAQSVALTGIDAVPWIVTASPSAITVIRPEDCSVVRELAFDGMPTQIAASRAPDGWVAAGTRGGEVLVWDGDGALRARLGAHDNAVRALAFDESGTVLVSGAWDGRIRVLDLGVLVAPRLELVEAIYAAWGRPPG